MSNKINIPEGWKNVNGEAMVSSVKIAEDFEKEHTHVCRDIQNLISQNPILDSDKYFIETSYKAGTGKNYKAYDVKRKGFSLLTMGFTGSAALDWKLKYIDTFDQMETALRKIAGQTLPSDSSNKSYAPKASSLGEVASFIKVMSSIMRANKQTPEKIAEMAKMVCEQFNVSIPDGLVVHNPYQQLNFFKNANFYAPSAQQN
jgi:Rha family phage regulatory protein